LATTRNVAILFDLDNTLHDRDAGLIAFVLRQYQDRELVALGVPADEWVERFVELDQRGRVWKDVVYEKLCKEFALPIAAESLLAEYVSNFAKHVRPHDGLVETLQTLRTAGWRTGIISNGRSAFQRSVVSALGIEELLDVVVISEECGFRKPDPSIFRLAQSGLGCAAEGSWFVGDDFEADVRGARGAGMRALWFGGPSESEDAVDDLRAVLERV
jgi:putative hydrolase of the HAD superfamily